jgi:hypothetical protein
MFNTIILAVNLTSTLREVISDNNITSSPIFNATHVVASGMQDDALLYISVRYIVGTLIDIQIN